MRRVESTSAPMGKHYHKRAAQGKPREPQATARVCLCMIVKDESHIIADTLRALAPYVRYWVVCDTGSADGTQDIVKRTFAALGVPGRLVQHTWSDFGTNRTAALDEAWTCREEHHCNYVWMFDADDTIEGALRIPADLKHDAYYMNMGGASFTYKRICLFKCTDEVRWSYRGVLHEFPWCKTKPHNDTHVGVIEGAYYINSRRLGARSQDPEKYKKDVMVLERALETEEDDYMRTRYTFYAAQSCHDAGMLDKAAELYEKRIALGGWVEERYYSALRIAMIRERNADAAPQDIAAAFLRAFYELPERAEPFYNLAHYFRLKNMFKEAYAVARLAQGIPYPKDCTLFVFKDVYDYKIDDEVAVSAFYLGRHAECRDLCKKLLARKDLPAGERARIEKNLAFCKTP